MRTPGSGGFGPLAERERAAIARDLRDGYVSEEGAERDYGIVDAGALLGE
jgi:N-methylhydantoinase B